MNNLSLKKNTSIDVLKDVQLFMTHKHIFTQNLNQSTLQVLIPHLSPHAGNVAALAPKRELSPGDYNVLMRIYDVGMLYQDSTLDIEVCQCQGAVSACFISRSAPHLHVPSLATSVLGAIFGLLCMWQVFLCHMMS